MKSVINEPLTERDRQSSDEVLDRGLLKSLKRQTSQSSGKVQDDSGGVSWVSSFLTLPVCCFSDFSCFVLRLFLVWIWQVRLVCFGRHGEPSIRHFNSNDVTHRHVKKWLTINFAICTLYSIGILFVCMFVLPSVCMSTVVLVTWNVICLLMM